MDAKAARRIAKLEAALIAIRDDAYSPLHDDWIWMRDDLPLGQFIDRELADDDEPS